MESQKGAEQKTISVFTIIIWSIAALALSVVGYIAINLNRSVQEEGELAFRKNLTFLCESSRKSVKFFLENVKVEVVYLTQLDSVKNYHLNNAGRSFKATMFQDIYTNILSHLILLDGAGEILLAVSNTPKTASLDDQMMSMAPQIDQVFQSSMESYFVSVSDRLIQDGGYKGLAFSMPIPRKVASSNPDEPSSLYVSGMVMAMVDMDEFIRKFIKTMSIEKSGFAWVAMPDGTILGDVNQLKMFSSRIYGGDPDVARLGRDFMQTVSGAPSGPFTPRPGQDGELVAGSSNDQWFISYSPFKLMDQTWYMAALAPRSEVTHLLERSFQQSTMLVLSVALILLVSGGLLTRVNRRLAAAAEKARLAAGLEEKNRSLAEMNRRMDEFVSVVSHDIRSPLNVIKGFVKVIQSSPGGERFERETSVMLRSCERLAQLTRDILDISKLEAGSVKLAYDPVVLDRIIQESVQIMEFAIKEKNIESKLNLGKETEMEADSGKLLQVMNNLIGNAVKFSPSQGTIIIEKSVHNGNAVITVSDSGPGLSEEDKGMVFSKFEQVKKRQQGVEPGYGLGLTICKNIIELHGGTIGVVSKLGEGATFHVSLPIKIPDPRRKASGREATNR